MKIVFISNFFNHHQSSLSEQLFDKTNHEYLFIETEKMDDERIKLGWGGIAKPNYVVYFWQNAEIKSQCEKKIIDADAVIMGSAPESLIIERLKLGKVVFRYSERPLKKGLEIHKYLYRFIKWHKLNKRKYNIYMLCASAYTASDYAKFGLFKNKCFKWGYFPKAKQYDNIDRFIEKKNNHLILWAARFLNWKHPELPVLLSKRLKEGGYDFTLKMIGTGEEKEKIEKLAYDMGVEDRIMFLGSMPPDEVRRYLEESTIFVSTSDRNEGWGAVINEAMNSACAVVANRAIGSVPYLIEDGENGFYYDGSLDDLYQKVRRLLDSFGVCKRIGKNAYKTIIETWNAENAANRFLKLVDCIESKKETPFKEGPCCSTK